ncbi:MAG: permease [Desulfurococcales archaeon]|nr:permease [Desulfurococcales archaeon]
MVEELLALLLFIVVVTAIIARVVEEAVAALAGVVLMIVLTGYTPVDAFNAIDWNVMGILFGMWVITGYMMRAGFSRVVLSWIVKRVNSYRALLLMLSLAAGFISMLVDNVLVILLFGALSIEAAKRARGNPVLAVLLVGFSANFMGTALLMGDLPPQLLHSIAGAEFIDFIWSRGRPSSFILLTITFLLTLATYYALYVRREPQTLPSIEFGEDGVDRGLLWLSTLFFALTVAGMAVRPLLGVPLGFITVSGAALLSLAVEAYRRCNREWPGFDEILGEVEWRALLFYASLFALVGGLEFNGVLEAMAEKFLPLISNGGFTAYTSSYWIVGALSTFVEHDALLLTFLYIARDAAHIAGFDPWPLYWAMAWSATLASNMTTAAAPALYVALTLAEEKGYRIGAREFLRYSVPFVSISLVLQFLLSAVIWA